MPDLTTTMDASAVELTADEMWAHASNAHQQPATVAETAARAAHQQARRETSRLIKQVTDDLTLLSVRQRVALCRQMLATVPDTGALLEAIAGGANRKGYCVSHATAATDLADRIGWLIVGIVHNQVFTDALTPGNDEADQACLAHAPASRRTLDQRSQIGYGTARIILGLARQDLHSLDPDTHEELARELLNGAGPAASGLVAAVEADTRGEYCRTMLRNAKHFQGAARWALLGAMPYRAIKAALRHRGEEPEAAFAALIDAARSDLNGMSAAKREQAITHARATLGDQLTHIKQAPKSRRAGLCMRRARWASSLAESCCWLHLALGDNPPRTAGTTNDACATATKHTPLESIGRQRGDQLLTDARITNEDRGPSDEIADIHHALEVIGQAATQHLLTAICDGRQRFGYCAHHTATARDDRQGAAWATLAISSHHAFAQATGVDTRPTPPKRATRSDRAARNPSARRHAPGMTQIANERRQRNWRSAPFTDTGERATVAQQLTALGLAA